MSLNSSQSNARELIVLQIMLQLRHTALSGSGRSIDPTKPLGSLGIGLDSLALLQFITALENQFAVELPDDLWTNQAGLTIDALTDLILKLRKASSIVDDTASNMYESATEPETLQEISAEPKSVRKIYRDHGMILGVLAGIIRFPKRVLQSIIRRDQFHVIAFDLITQPLPQFHATIPLTFRTAELRDLATVTKIWTREEQAEKPHLFQKRLAQGFFGFVAYADTDAVGIDWLSTTGDTEKFMGITVSLREGSCYGLDLNEHPDFRAQGVGMALVSYSLHEAKQRGFKKQYAIVHSDNEKMLGAAIHLLGFKKVGKISTLRLLGKPRSHWEVYTQNGHGPSLVL